MKIFQGNQRLSRLECMNWQKERSVEFLAEKWLPLTLIRTTKEEILALFKNWVVVP